MKSYSNKIFKNILSTILILLIFCASFLTIVNLTAYIVYIKTPIKGFSMQPTLNINVTNPDAEGDIIYINQFAEVKRNDIVVSKVDWNDDFIIKRVVGVPGDKIQIKDESTHYALCVNDIVLYTREKKGVNSIFSKTETNGYYGYYLQFLENEKFQHLIKSDGTDKYIQLGSEDYFLMGDNWGHTTDSIFYGPEKESSFLGKVDIVIDVTEAENFNPFCYFMKKIFS